MWSYASYKALPLRQRANILERGLTPPDLGNSFIGDSPEFRRLLNLIDRVAPCDSTVLITGETGAGKGKGGEADSRAQFPTVAAGYPAVIVQRM